MQIAAALLVFIIVVMFLTGLLRRVVKVHKRQSISNKHLTHNQSEAPAAPKTREMAEHAEHQGPRETTHQGPREQPWQPDPFFANMQDNSAAPAPSSPLDPPGEGPFRFGEPLMPLVFDASRSVTFVQRTSHTSGQTRGQPVQVEGWVGVSELAEHCVPGMHVWISKDDDDLPVDINRDMPTQKMEIVVPAIHRSVDHQPKVQIQVIIMVPRGSEINTLAVNVTQLDVRFASSLYLKAASTNLSSTAGIIRSGPPSQSNRSFLPAPDSYRFESRSINARTISGNILGNWPLNESLALASTSGDIRVSITPKESAQSRSTASLDLSTISGRIEAVEPIFEGDDLNKWIPPRYYSVRVSSTSGNIYAALACGGSGVLTEFRNISGKIKADLLPMVDWDDNGRYTMLETNSTSGDTEVCVLEACCIRKTDDGSWTANLDPDVALNRLQSTHKSVSGNISLCYPTSWEGDFFANSMSGGLKVYGPEVLIVWRQDIPKRLQARKGAKNSSSIQINTVSGGVEALIGEEQ